MKAALKEKKWNSTVASCSGRIPGRDMQISTHPLSWKFNSSDWLINGCRANSPDNSFFICGLNYIPFRWIPFSFFPAMSYFMHIEKPLTHCLFWGCSQLECECSYCSFLYRSSQPLRCRVASGFCYSWFQERGLPNFISLENDRLWERKKTCWNGA